MPTDDRAGPAGTEPPLAGRDYGITLWQPGPQVIENARVTKFARWLTERHGLSLPGYPELWQWSVTEPGAFWAAVWDYLGVLGQRGDGPVLSGGPMPDVTWFAGTTLNYARNALRLAATEPGRTAVIYRSETGPGGTLSYGELATEVTRLRSALRGLGVAKGDRVAAYLPNIPQALIGLLATASLGATWSSCSPDFGAPSVIDRFAQISPKVLLAVDGYRYNGKDYDRRGEVADIAAALPGLAAVIMVSHGDGPADAGAGLPARVLRWDELGSPPERDSDGLPEFTEVPFSHPLWVLYSSGTTGLPKPIVHGHGGIVLEHLKALAFHQDLGPGDVFFWYTTTGWMMWNYLAGGLLAGATVVLYDGSATYPATDALWRVVAQTGVTYAGTGAPYLLACHKAGLRPAAEPDLSALRGVGSTGSPLPPEGFRWVYDAVASGGPGAGRDSYFADFPGVWRHGDWIMMLPDGGCVIYGRSDATLNRGGVRMGTSDFYRVVERLPEVADSLVVDTGRLGAEGRLVLYVVPAAGATLDEELAGRIRSALRAELSPRHVPDEIHQVPGIPRTLSGKKLEVPVRKILLGTPVAQAADPDALANPEVLGYFPPRGSGEQGGSP